MTIINTYAACMHSSYDDVGGAAYVLMLLFIVFQVPLLKINNPNDKRIAFAIKTTAPKIFTVSPNSSIIQPHEEILVESMQ